MSELASTVNVPIGVPASAHTGQRDGVLERLLRVALWLVIVAALGASRSVNLLVGALLFVAICGPCGRWHAGPHIALDWRRRQHDR